MRLINVHTGVLEEFHGDIPQYAILSHTWGLDHEEILFRDIQDGRIREPGLGTAKFDGCCKQAKADGLDYAWIDTCCIDKANSTELSEAINSMFGWYRRAKICYAILQDVPSRDDPDWKSKFRASRWFTRGWTLQELLAPKDLVFYSSDWHALGTKLKLSDVIGEMTGIPARFLLGASNLHEASVAQRMSWAARRNTKRKEDIAYSLLGIFDLMIPMIYGEGDRAFIRLQEKIISRTADDSILAWGLSPNHGDEQPQNSSQSLFGCALAASPADFVDCGKISSWEHRTPTIEQAGISRGYLHLRLPLYTDRLGKTYGLLNCRFENGNRDAPVGIPLCRVAPGGDSDEYMRPAESMTIPLSETVSEVTPTSIRTHATLTPQEARIKDRRYGFSLENTLHGDLEMTDVYPSEHWEQSSPFIVTGIDFQRNSIQRHWTRFRYTRSCCYDFVLALEVEASKLRSVARCHVMIASRETSLDTIANAHLIEDYTFGKSNACNGVLNVQTKLIEEARGAHPIYVVRVLPLASRPDDTIDVTSEIDLLNQDLNIQGLFQESQRISPRIDELAVTIEDRTVGLNRTKDRLKVVQQKLDRLLAEKQSLTENLKKDTAELELVTMEKNQLAEKEKKICETVSVAQKLHVSAGEKRSSKWKDSLINYLSDAPFQSNNTAINAMPDKTQRAFMHAIENGNTPAMEFLIAHLPDLNFEDASGKSVLRFAITRGNSLLVSWLLEKGACVESRDSQGGTPLTTAAHHGFLASALMLLDGGANVNTPTETQHTPLHTAILGDHIEVMRLLLGRGANIETTTAEGWTPLAYAAKHGSAEALRLLIDNGANIEAKTNKNWTPLLLAARYNTPMHVRLLAFQGANIGAKSNYANTALHLAAKYGTTASVSILLDHGAKTEARNSTSEAYTVLLYATSFGTVETMHALLDKGADIKAVTKTGKTALVKAAGSGNIEHLKLLLDRGAEIEFRSTNGFTPLAWAADAGKKVEAKALISRGANIESKDSRGMTPLLLAAAGGHTSLATLLVKKAAEIEAKDDDLGRTALHIAAMNDYVEIIQVILDNGADIETRSKAGHTAIYYSIRYGRHAAFLLLLENGASLEVKGPGGKLPLQYARYIAQKYEDIQALPEMKKIIQHLEKTKEAPTRSSDQLGQRGSLARSTR